MQLSQFSHPSCESVFAPKVSSKRARIKRVYSVPPVTFNRTVDVPAVMSSSIYINATFTARHVIFRLSLVFYGDFQNKLWGNMVRSHMSTQTLGNITIIIYFI